MKAGQFAFASFPPGHVRSTKKEKRDETSLTYSLREEMESNFCKSTLFMLFLNFRVSYWEVSLSNHNGNAEDNVD